MKETTGAAMAPWFERQCHLMMYLFIKGKKESVDMIQGDDWVKVRGKTYFKWQRMLQG